MKTLPRGSFHNSACRLGTITFSRDDDLLGVRYYVGSPASSWMHAFGEVESVRLFGKKVCVNINSIKRYLQLAEERHLSFGKKLEVAFLNKLKKIVMDDFKKHHVQEFLDKLEGLIKKGKRASYIEEKLMSQFGLTHELFIKALDICGKSSDQKPLKKQTYLDISEIADSGLKVLEGWFR